MTLKNPQIKSPTTLAGMDTKKRERKLKKEKKCQTVFLRNKRLQKIKYYKTQYL